MKWKHFSLAVRVSLLYLLFGGLWILLSDSLLAALIDDPLILTQLQTYKGWAFVAASALVIFLFLRQETKRRSVAEKNLRESEERFRLLFEDNHDVMLLIEPETGKIRNANRAAETFYGYPLSQLCGMNIADINSLSREEIQQEMRRAAEKEKNYFIFPHRLASGEIRTVEVHSTPITQGGETLLFSIVHDITERKWIEDERQYLLSILDSSLNEIYLFDTRSLKFQYVNSGALRNLGYSLQQIKSLTPIDLKPAFNEASFRELIAPLLRRERETLTFETEHRRADGTLYPVEVHLQLVEHAGDEIFLAMIIDITERKRVERDLVESEHKYRALFENMNGGFVLFEVVKDEKGKPADLVILAANRGFEETTGLKPQNAIGKRLTDVLPGIERDPADWIGTYGKIALSGEPMRFEEESKLLGRYYSVNAYQPAPKQCAVTFIDITERKQAEEQLRLSEQKFFDAFHISPVAFSITRIADGTFVDVNDAFCRLFEYTREEVIGHTSTELKMLMPEERRKLIQRQLETGGLRNEELLAHSKTGKPVNLLFSSKPMTIEGEQHHLTIMIDITDRKLMEEELRLSRDRLAELSRQLLETQENERRAIGRELHDQFGQILTALKLTLDMAAQLPPGLAEKRLADAQQLADDLIARTSRISLDLRPPMLDDFGLIPALLWHINRFEEQSGIRVAFTHHGVQERRFAAEIETTAYRIIQEALTNAARHAKAKRIRLEVRATDGKMEIEIEDDGVGFDPQQALAKNHGLRGMSERAALAGGFLHIQSSPGRGARLSVRLPLRERQP